MIKFTLTIISMLLISPQLFSNNLTDQWVPKWQVGDWWLINFQSRFSATAVQHPPRYDPFKVSYGQCQYKVIGTEEAYVSTLIFPRPEPIITSVKRTSG